MEKKCILLIRVSTFNQDLTQQTEVVKAEAVKDGYTEKNIIVIEDHESAIKLSEEERNGLNRMKQHIEKDSSIDCVYVYEISRISRQAQIVFSIRDYLIKRKIQLIVIKPYIKVLNPDYTISETSTIFFSIFSGLAENEMYIKKARMRRGVEKAKAMGRHAGGHVPFGYTTDKQHLYHINEEQAKIVRWVFESYVNGWSMRRIAKELIETGVFTCTYLTAVQNINNMIHNDIYVGNKIGREQIVTKETFEKAQNICHRKTYHGDKQDTKRICKGILYDRNNGFLLSVNKATGTYFSKRAKGVAVSFKIIEPIIWEYATNKYKTLYKQNTQERNRRLLEDIVTLNIKMQTAKEQIEEKKQQLDKLEERIILGKVSEKLANKLGNQINGELEEIENKLTGWKAEEHKKQEELRRVKSILVGSRQSDGRMYYETKYDNYFDFTNMDIDEQIELVHQVIDRVILDRPSRTILNIEIHNKVDSKIDIMTIDTFRHTTLLHI